MMKLKDKLKLKRDYILQLFYTNCKEKKRYSYKVLTSQYLKSLLLNLMLLFLSIILFACIIVLLCIYYG